jgi:hypothetical protein
LDDPSNEASLCKVNYPIARDCVLEEGAWSFASQWAELPKLAEVPVFGPGSLFQLPADALRVFKVDDGSETFRAQWTLHGRKIQMNADRCLALIVYQVTDTSKFSPKFVEAVASRLAGNIAMPITISASVQSAMWELFAIKIRDALNSDNLQGRAQLIRSDTLVVVR